MGWFNQPPPTRMMATLWMNLGVSAKAAARNACCKRKRLHGVPAAVRCWGAGRWSVVEIGSNHRDASNWKGFLKDNTYIYIWCNIYIYIYMIYIYILELTIILFSFSRLFGGKRGVFFWFEKGQVTSWPPISEFASIKDGIGLYAHVFVLKSLIASHFRWCRKTSPKNVRQLRVKMNFPIGVILILHKSGKLTSWVWLFYPVIYKALGIPGVVGFLFNQQ